MVLYFALEYILDPYVPYPLVSESPANLYLDSLAKDNVEGWKNVRNWPSICIVIIKISLKNNTIW